MYKKSGKFWKGERRMTKENLFDELYVEDLNEFYKKTGAMTVVEDGESACSFNENYFDLKAYESMTDCARERYRNLVVAEMA